MKKIKNNSSLSPKVLTDKTDIEKIQPYLNALNRAINDNDVNNIAMTGAYGSGKSTIIRTYQNLNPKNEYLNISLGTFSGDESFDVKKENQNKISNLNRQIEVSILQQIFYHVKPSEIPDSRFERINSIKKDELNWIVFCSIIWLFSLVILLKSNYLSLLNPELWTYKLAELNFQAVVSVAIFFVGVGFGISRIIRHFNKTKISKLNFLKGEVELGKDIEKSIFNKHLDEIVYFFESTKYNVITIEDLDRFNSTQIFTKLREINSLLNNSKSIKRKITFVYAVRDDIFQNEERTKFFDYFIPVIPFINPSNANEQLLKLIKNAELESDFTEGFIDDVVTFINDIDMRLLINVFNEYTIYKESLKGNDLIQDNLLAVIIYKNLYPKDFVELSQNKGILYSFFKKRKEYISKYIEEVDLEIGKIHNEISDIENEQTDTIKELRSIYVNAIQERIPDAIEIEIEEERYNFFKLTNEDVFELLLDEDNIKYYYNSRYTDQANYYYNKLSGISFSEIENLVNEKFSFKERRSFILDRDNNGIDNLNKKILKLQSEKDKIESWDIKKIFEKINIELYLDDFSNSGLMQNLLLNGYINENYIQYISLFHEVKMTQTDFDFVRNVKIGKSLPHIYELKQIKSLIKKIPAKYFSRKTILNYDLLVFLLGNSEHNNKLKRLIELLSTNDFKTKENNDLFEFIKGYIYHYKVDSDNEYYEGYSYKNTETFIKLLIQYNSSFWSFVEYNIQSKKAKDNFLLIILKYADIDDIILNSENTNLKTYISSHENYTQIIPEGFQEKCSLIFQKLNIEFDILVQPTNENMKIFYSIYENHNYKININNVELIYNNYAKSVNRNKFNNSNYSEIIDSDCEHLLEYLEININDYVNNVLLKMESNDSETNATITYLINDEELNKNLLIKFLSKQKSNVEDLNEIDELDNKKLLLSLEKVNPDWNNIYNCYRSLEEPEIDKDLIDYLNKEDVYKKLSKSLIKDSISLEEKEMESFISLIIKSNQLTYESYIYLIKSTHYSWNIIGFEDLNINKIKYLVEDRTLNLTTSNYDKLKKMDVDLHITLIEKHQNEYKDIYEELDVNVNEFILLLNSKSISNKTKLFIYEKIEKSRIINNVELGNAVGNVVVNNAINIMPSYNLYRSLIENSKSIRTKVKLLNLEFSKFNDEEISILIQLFPLNYRKILIPKKRPILENTDYNLELIKNIYQLEMISSYKIEKEKIRVYPFNKK